MDSTYEPNEQGEHVVIACWAVPGMCYPISRSADYRRTSQHSVFFTEPNTVPPKQLKNQFQSHYVAVNSNDCEIVDGIRSGARGDYDEVVFRESAQLLPAFRLYFRSR